MVATDSRSSGAPYDWLMPMQPSPSAETSSPCVPSVRVASMCYAAFGPARRATMRSAMCSASRPTPWIMVDDIA